MDSGQTDGDRQAFVTTPNSQHSTAVGGVLGNEVDFAALGSRDPNNSSHYYRFKRHSLGYQSQGPPLIANKNTLIGIEAMNSATGGREQS